MGSAKRHYFLHLRLTVRRAVPGGFGEDDLASVLRAPDLHHFGDRPPNRDCLKSDGGSMAMCPAYYYSFAQPAVRIGGTLVCVVLEGQALRRDLPCSLFPRCLSFWKT